MSALNAPRTAREVAVPAAVVTVTTATVAFLLWLYLTRTAAVVLEACGMLAAVCAAGGITFAAVRMMRTDGRAWYCSDDPAEHLQPLQQEADSERNLTIDLRARRMLLRPWGLSERHARALAVKVSRRARRMRAVTHGPAMRPEPAPETAPAGPDEPELQATPREPLAASLRAALARLRVRSLRLPQRKLPAPKPHSHRKPRGAARPRTVTPPLIPYASPEVTGRLVEARQRAVAAHEDTAVLPAPLALPQAQNDPGCAYPDWKAEDSGIMRALRGEPV